MSTVKEHFRAALQKGCLVSRFFLHAEEADARVDKQECFSFFTSGVAEP